MLLLQMLNPFPLHYAIILILISSFLTPTAAVAGNSEVKQFLGVQNAARSALRLPPLVWDARIERYAAGYAAQRRADCELLHSNGPYGENIFWGSGNRWTAGQAAAAWVSERRGYNYWSNSCVYGQDCGHYTQIVWRGTRRVGCARVVCYGGRGVFMICNYDPPGNYVGERPY
ncbi:pathogenesis-related protein PR-1 [Salvia miltiorrhiza]|uniref:pathogenesis-related protein PR-1-like n=1 Tax=Salvia miltiorrhiza TaxID=226208 RepID=UPI0025AB7012|nr:pathogenesis-related protein PR-1-like [Salvia miltiorrhiza]XP_057787732.1 pathogenesis-related protein PR-1 [Salvia miltiorrhiza]